MCAKEAVANNHLSLRNGGILVNRFLHFANTVFPLEVDLRGTKRARETGQIQESEPSHYRLFFTI